MLNVFVLNLVTLTEVHSFIHSFICQPHVEGQLETSLCVNSWDSSLNRTKSLMERAFSPQWKTNLGAYGV